MQVYTLQRPNNLNKSPSWVQAPRECDESEHVTRMRPYAGALVVDRDGAIKLAQARKAGDIQFGGWNWGRSWFLPVCEVEAVAEVFPMIETGVVVELRASGCTVYLVRAGVIAGTIVDPPRLLNNAFWQVLGRPT